MTKGDADVAGNQQAHSSRAFDPAVLSRDFSAVVERREADSSGLGRAYRTQLLWPPR
jgi:hypothetical protein